MNTMLGLSAITAVLLLGSISLGVGQGSPQPMYTGPIAVDYSCSLDNTPCGQSWAGCSSLGFTAESTGQVYIHVWIQCNPSHENCGNCYACAIVLNEDGSAVSDLVHTFCPDCDDDDMPPLGFTLQQGRNYKLVVCKRPCEGTCDDCSSDCAAMAQVHG